MLTWLHALIINISERWWKILLAFLATFVALQGLLRIDGMFPEHAGGAQPFDMQNDLTVDAIFSQLAAYSDTAFGLYWQFTAIDYFFPVFGALFQAALTAVLLRYAVPDFWRTIESRKLILLMLLPAAFDWLENITLLLTMLAWPEEWQIMATAAVAAKKAKLATLFAAQGIAGLSILAAACRLVLNLIQRGRSTPQNDA